VYITILNTIQEHNIYRSGYIQLAFANQVPVTICPLHMHACTHTHSGMSTVRAHYCLILIDPPESCEYTQ
jgi:hypothetical protein